MVIGVGALSWVLAGTGPTGAPDSAVAATPAAPAPTAAAAPAAVTGPSVAFVSLLGDTKKMKVQCGTLSAQGELRTVIAGDAFPSCTVTAVDGARKRLTAVVQNVTAREYSCFRDGAQSCE